jgi:hypothetical protein
MFDSGGSSVSRVGHAYRTFGSIALTLETALLYAFTFLVLMAVCLAAPFVTWNDIGWIALLPAYVSVSFGLLAVAYAGVGSRVLFKRQNGGRSPIGWLLLAPYFVLNEFTFRAYRLLSREPPFVQVAPNLSFGRRLLAYETETAGWASVLDLAGEFTAARLPQRYRSLPVLDATAPTETELQSAVAWIAEGIASGTVYVHCALGHGRSACVILAYLLQSGLIDSVDSGIERLRSLRPGVRIHPPQRRLLQRFQERLAR